jgi:hypothetical protein
MRIDVAILCSREEATESELRILALFVEPLTHTTAQQHHRSAVPGISLLE